MKAISVNRVIRGTPHGWVAEDEAIFDRFGRDFTLVRFGETPEKSDQLVKAADACGLPLTVLDIADANLTALYGMRLVLVRPDGHVAWRGDACPNDSVALMDKVRGAA